MELRVCTLVFFIFTSLFPVGLLAKTSNDPYVTQWAYEDIGVYSGWDITTGSHDVVVAIIDNGFDTFHPDLIDNAWKNTKEISDNRIDDDGNGYVDDVWGWNFMANDTDGNGIFNEDELRGNNDPRPSVDLVTGVEKKKGVFDHGTIVAGIIGARGDNEIDGVGLNWNVHLMNLKVLGNEGFGTILPLSRAIRYAVDNGAHIINISMVGQENLDEISEAIQYAHDKGVLIVAAAGNNSVSLNYSKFFPICADAGKQTTILGVSSINEEHRISNFSNVGSDCIDIAAPGENIASTIRFSPTNGLTERYGRGFSGTSFAAPLISGAAALIKSIQPTWTANQIIDALLKTVHHTPNQNEETYAQLFGKGMLRIDRALAFAVNSPNAVKVSTTSLPMTEITYEQTDPLLTAHPGLWEVDLQKGYVNTHQYQTIEDNFVTKAELRGLDDATVFSHKGNEYIATIQKKNAKVSIVTIYNDRWEKVAVWTAPQAGKLSIKAGNIQGNSEAEIIIAPQTPQKNLYTVYSFSGKKISTKSLTKTHAGVSLGLTGASPSAIQDILAVYKTKNGYVLSVLSSAGKEKKNILLPWLTTLGGVASGDVDGDGEEEFVVTNGKGQGSFIAYYTQKGELYIQFSHYESSYKGGLDVNVLDYDHDGKADIITLPRQGGFPIVRFSGNGQKIQEWPTASQKVGGDLKLLIQPFPLTK